MQHVIIVIHLMLVLALIGVVLLQRSEGGGLGIGSTGGFMTSRGTANVLTRATAILAGLFFVDQPAAFDPGRHQPQADLDPAGRPERAGRARRAGAARSGGGGLLNQLQGGAPPAAPAAPAAPSGPQVPQSK